MSLCVVLITVPDKEAEKTVTDALVASRLVACVNQLSNISSVFQWQGKIEQTNEILLICKTRQALMPQIIDLVKEKHPYDVPEIIALPIISGSQPYLDWVMQETKEAHAND